jgi:hypothetical protein
MDETMVLAKTEHPDERPTVPEYHHFDPDVEPAAPPETLGQRYPRAGATVSCAD